HPLQRRSCPTRRSSDLVEPAEQRQAEMRLERFHLMADRRRRHMQLGRGLAEAEMPRRGLESAQRVERGQASRHRNLRLENLINQDRKSTRLNSSHVKIS